MAPTQGNNTLSTCLWAPVPWRVHRGPSYFAPTRHKEPPKELESASSDEENEDGDFTVYECPGLAPVSAPGGMEGGFCWRFLSSCLRPCCQELDPVSSQTGEMEVRNPLFDHSTLSAPVPGPRSLPPLQ